MPYNNDDFAKDIDSTIGKIIVDNKESLKQIIKFKDTVDWYRKAYKASKEPGELNGMVLSDIIRIIKPHVLENFEIGFNKVVLDAKNNKTKQIKWSLQYQLPTIKPFVEFEIQVLVEGVQTKHKVLKLSFEVDSSVRAEGEIYSDKYKKYAKLRRLGVNIELYAIIEMMLGKKKKKIGEKDFYREDVVLAGSDSITTSVA
jgi:hypothetical protein